jgi:hypothetical protein
MSLAPRDRDQSFRARDWNSPAFTAREFYGVGRCPIYCLCRRIRNWAKALKGSLFCEQRGQLMGVGTKSLLIGVQQLLWHPITVYLGWCTGSMRRWV